MRAGKIIIIGFAIACVVVLTVGVLNSCLQDGENPKFNVNYNNNYYIKLEDQQFERLLQALDKIAEYTDGKGH
jgi:hypothetical protein